MTPKEKAEELVDKFKYESKHYLMLDAEKCALIAVDEILKSRPAITDSQIEYQNYWQEVKQEIENL